MKRILIALVLAACGGKQATPPTNGPTTTVDTKPGTGKVGDVCALGEHHTGSGGAVACGAGLNCCYTCGIPGCDSTCYAGECPTDIP